ncbi:MAG: L-threonylcarbamoyladenylate synthase [Eubacteriales bacterium]|nr:L-threonylcarbamoyladenylate synthase [Eubacteriales bacterium]
METLLLELADYKKTGIISTADAEKLGCAAKILREGGLAAFPTETVYGLGGNALDQHAAAAIYAAKGRPSDNPLIVHISCMAELPPVVEEIPVRAQKLAEAFWPGPLTMIMKKAKAVPYETTGGLDTVAVRMPEHAAARQLIALSGIPVAAPSANTSGRPSPTTAEHVAEDLMGKIGAIVDGGPAGIGVESTIVDLSGKKAVLLRPGAITREMLETVLGEQVEMDPALERPLDASIHPKAPGMKYRHYAPKAQMMLAEPADGIYSAEGLGRITERLCREADERLSRGQRVGIICSGETLPVYEKAYGGREDVILASLGSHEKEENIAHNLFSVLREMDARGVEFIAAEGVRKEALGYAIMNRMKKAAGQNVVLV